MHCGPCQKKLICQISAKSVQVRSTPHPLSLRLRFLIAQERKRPLAGNWPLGHARWGPHLKRHSIWIEKLIKISYQTVIKCTKLPELIHIISLQIPYVISIWKKSQENLSTLCCKYPTASTKISNPPPLKCQNLHFVCHLLAEDPVLTIPSVVAILPVFDEFLPISSKPDHLCRFSRRPTLLIVVLTLCLPPARCGPRPSILSVETILPNFVAFLQISSKLRHL